MHSATKELSTALKLSEEILALSEESQWDEVEQQLDQRDQLIKSALDSKINPTEADNIRALISQIKQIDEKIASLAAAQQNEISSEIKKQNKGKKMQAAYAQAKRL